MTELDISKRLVARLERLENHLAYVVSLHLFVEFLMNKLIEAGSPLTPTQVRERIVKNRNFTFALKLDLLLHMGALPQLLYENVRSLNRLRNEYAHEMDVDLSESLFARDYALRDGRPAFEKANAQAAVSADPENAGFVALHHIRDVTFGWLLSVCQSRGVGI